MMQKSQFLYYMFAEDLKKEFAEDLKK